MSRLTARPALLAITATLAVALVVCGVVLWPGGSASSAATTAKTTAATGQAPSRSDVPDDADPNLAPLPDARPEVVEPEAGGGSAGATATDAAGDDMSLPEPTGPASDGATAERGAQGTGGRPLKADTATALGNGVALPPLDAPEPVLDVIRAGNIIARTPYKWGGGHGRFQDNGYDCSGSVSYALYFAGLLDQSYTSGELMRYGDPGKGKWITLYANGGHVFMEVAGIRFDTSGQRVTGSRWQNEFRGTGGFVARHPPGL